uniref:Uncharacterized protein n=1 Tax=Picea glauca TaxID=3330 RepID=A0A101LTU8_PICGL|nr:hypothetical protein ABT39_MTgene3564 [Picea glauca]
MPLGSNEKNVGYTIQCPESIINPAMKGDVRYGWSRVRLLTLYFRYSLQILSSAQVRSWS